MSEWQKVKIGDICNFVKGETGIAKAEAGEYPLVVTGKERKTCDSFQLDCKAVCIPLVSSSGHGKASLNYVHYQEGKFALGSILVAVIPKDENVINAQFLHIYLSRLKDSLLVPLMKGTANVSLSVALIKNIAISLPTIERQIEIVNLFNQIDLDHQELAEENTNQQTYLNKLRQAILQEAIEGKLTADWRVKNPVEKGNPDFDAAALLETIKAEKQKLMADGKIKKEKPLAPINPDDVPFALPDGWVWVRLGEVAEELSTGPFGATLHKSDYIQNGIPVINPTNIIDGHIRLNKKMTISEMTKNRLQKYVLKAGDMVIARRGNLSKCGIVKECQNGWICGTGSFFMRTLCINNEFLQLAYTSASSQKYLLKDSVGQTMDNLNQKLLIKLPFSLPPLAEQNAIVERVDRLLESVNALEQQVAERKTYAEQLMQAVLKEAFAG
jgi:type I restriction enzyme S subunit